MSLVTSDFTFNADGRDYKGRVFCDSDWGPEKKFPGVLMIPGGSPDPGLEKLAKRFGDLKFASILVDEPLPAPPKGLRAMKRAMFFAQMRDEIRTDEICAMGFGAGADIVLRAAAESKMLAAVVSVYPEGPEASDLARSTVVPAILVLGAGKDVGEAGADNLRILALDGATPGSPGYETLFSEAIGLFRKQTYEKPVEEKPYIPAVTDYMGM
ncbi:MAG TPA: dienelactone hydrolase family protein [Thermoplasmata archaeon]|nr:dienelactone hydrolase family protein [Thermoplasmata archaeon]